MPNNFYEVCECDSCRAFRQTRERPPSAARSRTRVRCDECYDICYSDQRQDLSNGYRVCPACFSRSNVCAECSNRTFNSYETVHNGRICPDCARGASRRACYRCSRYGTTDTAWASIERHNICPSCLPHLSTCDACDHQVLRRYTTVSEARICRECSHGRPQCAYCNYYADHAVDHGMVDIPGGQVCATCHEDHYTTCDDCGDVREMHGRCARCYRDPSVYIRNYMYKPDAVFHGSGTKMYLGLELEVATRQVFQCAELAAGSLGDLGYLKYDGSVSGFEIVTHPMTHEYACESFPWEMLEGLADRGGAADDSTGIHVHVSRDGFDSKAHQYRWMKLIYRNERGVTGIARRTPDQWGRFTPEARERVKEVAIKNGQRAEYSGRYEAINVLNEHTFEVRVFRSSLDRTEVQAALSLVAASVEYTRNLTVPTILAGGWGWDAFRAWVAERPEYTALSEEMARCAS